MRALHDQQIEKAVLASILRFGEEPFQQAMSAGLEPEHFYDQRNRIVCRACLRLAGAGTPIDTLSVKRFLEQNRQLDDVGTAYLCSLEDPAEAPVGLDVGFYAGKLVELAHTRKIVSAAANIQTAAANGNGDLQDAIGDIRNALEGYESTTGEREQRGLSAKVNLIIDSIEGSFSTNQIYADLGITDVKGKAVVRQALSRLNGKRIQPYGGKAGFWRVICGDVQEMDFSQIETEELDLWLPFDLHNYVVTMKGQVIVITGDPDAGKTALLLNIIKRNYEKWNCHYFNSEMGKEELYKRLRLFDRFPIGHTNFHAYERSADFQDVIQPGAYSLNIIDYLEITDEFYLIGKHINDIHRALGDAVAIIAIQKKNRNSDMPLGAQRALEKPRLAIALNAGSKSEPNRATILKAKNRKTDHSLIGLSRTYKLIGGSEFRCDSPEWS